MLDIPKEEQERKEKRVNLRLNDSQNKALDKLCEDKGIKSRSKVLKSALDLVTKGTSDINFDVNHSMDETKLLDLQVHQNCPHCNGKLHLDLENLETTKEIETKVVAPSFIPGYRCKFEGCTKVHPNPNYQNRPKGICSVCSQLSLSDNGDCPFCNNINTLRKIQENELNRLHIPYPSNV